MPYHLAMAPYIIYYTHIFVKYASIFFSDSYGNRTRVTAVKGRCLNRLTKEPFFCFSEKLTTVPSKPHTQNTETHEQLCRLLTRDCFRTALLCLWKFSLAYARLNDLPTKVQPSTPSCLHQVYRSSPRPISSSQLHASLHFHLCPIYLVVFKGSYSFRMGHLILRGASRLDAFSVYPFRTWLPCHGLGKPTGTPAVRPSRSSRTKDSSSQMSYAHAG